MLLKVSEIKNTVKEAGKRTSKDFITAFNAKVEADLKKAIAEHNGGLKTLNAALVQYLWNK